jgi:hypothetical protein
LAYRPYVIKFAAVFDGKPDGHKFCGKACYLVLNPYILSYQESTWKGGAVNRMKPIRFRFSPEKAQAAIQWMLEQRSVLDLHTVLKACYFADKDHLNRYQRPIFGATYRAMRFGPVPLEIYEMTRGEAIWLPELEADRYPWELHGFRLRATANSLPDLDVLSESDMEALRRGFELSTSLSFNERTKATHGPDWQAARLGIMRYEDMIDESADKARLVAYLREAGPYMRL